MTPARFALAAAALALLAVPWAGAAERGDDAARAPAQVTSLGGETPVDLVVAVDDGELRREIARFDALLLAALDGLGAVDAPEDAVFRGDREDLEEIAGNLLENACKWARRRVRVQARAEPSSLLLAFDDDGPGLAPDVRERALARGGRLDERAPGSGLGLAIVQEVVALHGGALALEASALGGLRAVVRLPRDPAAARGSDAPGMV